MITSRRISQHLYYLKPFGSELFFKVVHFAKSFKFIKTTVTAALTLFFFTSPSEVLAAAKSISCADSFSINSASLTSEQILEELFNYKILYVELNEQRRMQASSSGYATGQSIASLEVELQTRKIRLKQFGFKDFDFAISKSDLIAIKEIHNRKNLSALDKSGSDQQNQSITEQIREWQISVALDSEALRYAEFSRDGSKILTIGSSISQSLQVLDATDLTTNKTIEGKFEYARFSADGKTLMGVRQDEERSIQKVNIYNSVDGSIENFIGDVMFATMAVLYTADEQSVITLQSKSDGSASGTIWDLKSKRPRVFFGGKGDTFYRASISSDGSKILTVGFSGIVRLWSVKRPNSLPEQPTNAVEVDVSSIDSRFLIHTLAPDANSFAVINAYNDGVFIVQALSSGFGLVKSFRRNGLSVSKIVHSPDSQYLAIGSVDGKVIIYDLLKEKIEAEFQAADSDIRQMAFSFDNQSLFISTEKTKILWKLQSLISGGLK